MSTGYLLSCTAHEENRRRDKVSDRRNARYDGGTRLFVELVYVVGGLVLGIDDDGVLLHFLGCGHLRVGQRATRPKSENAIPKRRSKAISQDSLHTANAIDKDRKEGETHCDILCCCRVGRLS